MRFQLEPGTWYAAEIIGEEFGEELRSYSPIKVERVTPRKDGSRTFELEFYHANYPEGVRSKHYSLTTIERNSRFSLCRSTEHDPVRYILIYPINETWMRVHFGIQIPAGETTIDWLERNA